MGPLCEGPIELPETRSLQGIFVTYAQSGIGSINMILDNLNVITLGDQT